MATPTASRRRSSSASSEGSDAFMPIWMEDSASSQCILCEKSFSTFVRRHHCRSCGILCCSKCSTHRNAKSQRTCDRCHSHRRGSISVFADRMSSPPTPRLPHSSSFTVTTPAQTHAPASALMQTPSAHATPHATPRIQASPVVPASMPALQSLDLASEESNFTAEDGGGPPSSVEWMPNKQSTECVLCFRAFTMLLRRHHCRSCGILVCSKCSSHRVALPTNKGNGGGATALKDQRVCDTCFESGVLPGSSSLAALGSDEQGEGGASRTLPAPVVVNHREITSVAVLSDPNLTLPPLPSWTYAFGGPGSGVGEMIPLGRLYVRVICAVNLPAMNRIMNTTDPYCTLHCAGQSHRTRIVTNSLNPRFEQEFYFDVLSAREDRLTLLIFDWDQLGKDKHVAYLTVPLSELSHSHRTTRWYELSHLSEQARKASNMKAMELEKLKADMRKKDRQLLEGTVSATASATASSSAATHCEVRVARPRIQLELQYVYNESGAFFSHVSASDPECPSLSQQQNSELIPQEVFHPQPPFDVDVLYSDLWRLLDLLKPVTDGLAAIGPLLAWRTPHVSFAVLVAFVLVCFHPFMFLVLIEALALVALLFAYIARVETDEAERAEEIARVTKEHDASQKLAQRKKSNLLFRGVHDLKNLWTGAEDDAPAAINARRQSLLQRLNPLTTAPDGRALDVKDRSLLNGLVTNALNGMLVTFGLHGNLASYQAMLTRACDQIERLKDILSWKDRTVTRYVAIGIGVLLVYSLFLPQKYLILLAGGYVLTMFTPPSQQALRAVLGLVAYIAVRRSRGEPPVNQTATTAHRRRLTNA